MIFLLSPAKSLNFDIGVNGAKPTTPSFLSDSQNLISLLKTLSAKDLAQLMKISDKLAQLNYQRFQDFSTPFTSKNSKPAIFVFDGDVYNEMDVKNYTPQELDFAQRHLRILSGLYGALRPLDLMQAYRLEMGTVLKNARGKNLYQFWQEKITDYLNEELAKTKDKVLLNLASEEYFGAVDTKKIKGRIINIIFKEKKDNNYKIVGIFAKKARGSMANFIIKNKIETAEMLKKFTINNYKFYQKFSDENNWCFCR
jgi:cytoplasmic iron level regulating protein YaaA (DUF328/UPF0246 family)